MPGAPPHSFEEWVRRLRPMSLAYLTDQTQPFIRGHNGDAHDDAVAFLIQEKKDAGECVLRVKQTRILEQETVLEEDCIVEHVPSGPRGQTERVLVPRHLYTS